MSAYVAGVASQSEVPGGSDPARTEATAALPVSPAVEELFPGGLPRGRVISVQGSLSVVWEMIAAATQAGAWVAVVGVPSAGVVAAAECGVVLERLVLVPRLENRASDVVAALIEGVDVVVLNPTLITSEALVRKLSNRVRYRKMVLISVGPWSGARHQLRCQAVEWTGMRDGQGFLRTRRIQVETGGRGAAARGIRVELTIPASAGARDKHIVLAYSSEQACGA